MLPLLYMILKQQYPHLQIISVRNVLCYIFLIWEVCIVHRLQLSNNLVYFKKGALFSAASTRKGLIFQIPV